jgi:hypothetical protein
MPPFHLLGIRVNGPGDPVSSEDGLFQNAERAVKTLRRLEAQGRDAAGATIDGAVKGDH